MSQSVEKWHINEDGHAEKNYYVEDDGLFYDSVNGGFYFTEELSDTRGECLLNEKNQLMIQAEFVAERLQQVNAELAIESEGL